MKVINEAKKSANKRKTAEANRIDDKLVRNWINQESQIKEDLLKCKNKVTPKAQTPFRCGGGGRKVLDLEMEKEVYDWVVSLRSEHLRVTRQAIMRKALELCQQIDFKASRGWLENFMNRFELSLRKKTHQSQRLPKDVAMRTKNFFIFYRKYLETYPIEESDIIAADQTPIYFDNVGATTVDQIGSKTISLKSTGHDKMNFTVMLSASACGTKKKMFIVFTGKGKNPEGKKLRARTDVYITYSDNGWFDDAVTEEYLDFLYPNRLFEKQRNRLLVWDAYKVVFSY